MEILFSKQLCSNCITLFLVLLLPLIVYLRFRIAHNYWKKRSIPYEKPVFLAGSLWQVFSGKRQIGRHLGDLYKKFDGPYFGIYICGKPYLVIRNLEIVKDITVRDFSNFEDRTFACDKNADDMSGNSLFIIRNPDWRNIRNKLSSIFTSGKIRQMFPLMTNTAEEMQKYLENHDGDVLDMKDVAGTYMTDLVAKCFFGIESNSFREGKESDFRKACVELMNVSIYRSFCLFSYFFVPILVSVFKLKLLDTKFFKQVFLDTLYFRQRTGFKRNDFVDLLIQVRDTFEEDSTKGTVFDTTCMVAQAITFFVAGFETTSNLLGFSLYELSLKEDFQEELRKEIFETFPNESEPVTFDKMQQMQYLNMVVAETLRRYPFGPFLNRRCKEDYVIKQTGFKIEKGIPVIIPLDGIHFDSEYYTNPEQFDPERFRNGFKHLANSCAYIPFGNGPRNCIGDRFGQIGAKVGLVHFLRKFRVEKCDQTQDPLILNPKSPFMVPEKGLKLRVRRLEQKK